MENKSFEKSIWYSNRKLCMGNQHQSRVAEPVQTIVYYVRNQEMKNEIARICRKKERRNSCEEIVR